MIRGHTRHLLTVFHFFTSIFLALPSFGQTTTIIHLDNVLLNSKADCKRRLMSLIECPKKIILDSASDITIDGNGLIVEFSDPRPGMGGIQLSTAKNVTLKNFEVRWLNGRAGDPFVRGQQRIQSFARVETCRNNQRGGIILSDLPLNGKYSLGAVSLWDDQRGWPWFSEALGPPDIYFPKNTDILFTSGRSECVPQLEPVRGRRILVRHFLYSNHAIYCQACSSVTLTKIRVTSAPGMAFVFGEGGQDLKLIGNFVGPECNSTCSKPEPSIAADAVHIAGVAGPITIKDNEFGWQGDDGINITGLLAPASPMKSEQGLTILKIRSEWISRISMFEKGCTIYIYTSDLVQIGQATIVSVSKDALLISTSSELKGDDDIIIARADRIPSDIIISGNYIHDNRARGMLLGGSNAVVYNNKIERTTMPAILLPADTAQWYEGPGARNVQIFSNTISDVNQFPMTNYPSAISAGVDRSNPTPRQLSATIRDITIYDNLFLNINKNRDRLISFGSGSSGSDSGNKAK